MQLQFKRLVALIGALALIFSCAGALAVTPSDYDVSMPQNLVAEHLYCESALLVDAQSGEILFSNNSRVRMYPASTTKIATLYLGIVNGPALDEVITVPSEAADIASDSSVIPIKPGDRMTYRDLLYSFMMTSGNDGANAIAVLTGGSISAFVESMNNWVNEIGCTGTHFVNAHGLHDEQHYTTAQDLALMARVAMENEVFQAIVACARYDMTITRNGETVQKTVQTRNTLLIPDQKYYYSDCIGVKTGHTGKAGYCFVGAAQRDGMRVISVVLNCPEDQHKWYDSAKLFEYGFTRYEEMPVQTLFDAIQDTLATVTVSNADGGDIGNGKLALNLSNVSTGDFSLKVVSGSDSAREKALSDFRENVEIVLRSDIEAPIAQGEILGQLRYVSELGGVLTAELSASRSVEKQPDPTPTPEPTAVPMFYFGNDDGRMGGIIRTLFILLVAVLIMVAALSAIGSAKKRARRKKILEQRRRAQMRRQRNHSGQPPRRNGGGYSGDRRRRY